MFLCREKGTKTVHHWNGIDTACRMWSTGGLKKSKKWLILKTSENRPICHMCQIVMKKNEKMKSPIEMLIDQNTEFKHVTGNGIHDSAERDQLMPYATHEGVFKFMDHEIRCYKLNTGDTVFNSEDIEKLFDFKEQA